MEQFTAVQSSLPQNIAHQPFAPDNAGVNTTAAATHRMHDLVSVERLNWASSLHTSTNEPGSLHIHHSNCVTVKNGYVAAITTDRGSGNNLAIHATAALETTERGYLRETSSVEPDIGSTLATRSNSHSSATNSGRRIGRIRRYNGSIAAYSAWADIYAGDDTGHKYIALNRGGKIGIHTSMVSREKKIALSNAMHQCNLYRQYTRSQVYHEPRFHVLLSTKAAQSDVGYMYHGIKMKALPIDVVPEVASYATELARVYKLPQNQWDIGVDLILYKDGDDSIGWHADDTQGESVILCVVIDAPGDPRPIHVRPNKRFKQLADGDEEIQLFIGEGDGYDMDGLMQLGYEHCLPKRSGKTAHRFVLIFRHGNEAQVSEDTGVALTEMSDYPQTAPPDTEIGCLASFLSQMRSKAPLVSFGHPQGVLEGSCYSRRFLFSVNAHRADQRGINGNMNLGSDSIVVSRQSIALREEDGGGALCLSYSKHHPIRVFRSSNLNSEFAPPVLDGGQTSYRYDGLYMVTKIWDSKGNAVGMNNAGIPAGGAQFTFHLDRMPKMELYLASSSDCIYNRCSLQELWEKILISHVRQHRSLFEPPRPRFADQLPTIWNVQMTAKSQILQPVSRLSSSDHIKAAPEHKYSSFSSVSTGRLCASTSELKTHKSITGPRSDIWIPIENFRAWHMKKKELWSKERTDRRECKHPPEMNCKSHRRHLKIERRELANRNGTKRKRKEKIAMLPDASEEIEAFLLSIIREDYMGNCIQLTDNASRQLEAFATRSLRDIWEVVYRKNDASCSHPSTTFNVKEKIFAWDRNRLYEAKVVKMKEDPIGCTKYLVHFVGYSKNHDKWLLSSDMHRDIPAVRKHFDEQK